MKPGSLILIKDEVLLIVASEVGIVKSNDNDTEVLRTELLNCQGVNPGLFFRKRSTGEFLSCSRPSVGGLHCELHDITVLMCCSD